MPPGERASYRGPRVLHVRAAGFPRRLMAALIDAVIVLVVSAGVTAGAALILGVPLPHPKELGPDLLLAGILDRNPMAVGAVGLLVGIGALYHIYFGGMTGQTVGKRMLRLRVIGSRGTAPALPRLPRRLRRKRLMHLRVIGARGTAPGALGGIVRFVTLVLSVTPAGLGWLWCLFDRERRALHDHLAGTYVIVEER